MVKNLELTAREKSFLNTMISGNRLESVYGKRYGCDPCDACGPDSCEDCSGCVEGFRTSSINPFGAYRLI